MFAFSFVLHSAQCRCGLSESCVQTYQCMEPLNLHPYTEPEPDNMNEAEPHSQTPRHQKSPWLRWGNTHATWRNDTSADSAVSGPDGAKQLPIGRMGPTQAPAMRANTSPAPNQQQNRQKHGANGSCVQFAAAQKFSKCTAVSTQRQHCPEPAVPTAAPTFADRRSSDTALDNFQYTQPCHALDWSFILSLDSQLEAGTATVSTLTDVATLDHLCHTSLVMSPGCTDSARLLFRVLQAAGQCCVDLQQRYVAAAAQAAQWAQYQLELMPALKAYESTLQARHAALRRAVAAGTQTPTGAATCQPLDCSAEHRAAADLPHLRAAAAARQEAVLAALASVRHARGVIAQQTWRRPAAAPLDWRAVCNVDARRLHEAPRGALGAAAGGAAAHTLAMSASDTQALLRGALAAVVCGDLDAPGATASRVCRVGGNGGGAVSRGNAERLVEVAQAALQWGRWCMGWSKAVWDRACEGLPEMQNDIEARTGAVARLEHAVAEMQQEAWRLPVGRHAPSKSSPRDLHLLRAQLRNVRCVNGPHGVEGAYYVPPGLQLPCRMLVDVSGASKDRSTCTTGSVQAERWHAIKQSSAETQVTLQKIKKLRSGVGCTREVDDLIKTGPQVA
eukprot:jgi/Ulvmu1/1573/UM111_0001.1